MSGATGGTKAVFPLSLPLAGQTLLFPGPPNSSVARCDSHCRGRLPPLDSAKNRCSCESLHGHPSPPTVNSHSRILLPVSPPNQTVPSSFGSFSGSSLSDPWLRIASAASRSSYEPVILSGFPLYGKLSTDNYPSLDYALLANARRKNATRETTSTLKAWLNEHRKNPYPTKGEKIMLAILTKMTLTQVSTWFANARRRLKKENKMTWSPRKKTGERKLASGATKSDNISECDSDADDDEDDDESMDIHVEIEDKAELPTPVSGGRQNVDSLSVDSRQSASRAVNSEPVAVTRPSVIRVMESPTFDEIKNRFKNDCSPVNNLQKWVNGCFVGAELSDYPRDLTPPNTPLDDRVSPSASQKIFDAFCLKFDHRVAAGKAADVAAVEAQGPAVPVMTPQPSPRAGDTVSAVLVRYGTENSNDQPSKDASRGIPSQNEVRTQGLTTSREFEAVLALTALSKT